MNWEHTTCLSTAADSMSDRVKQMLYPGSPWAAQYPELANVTTDTPCAPAYCEVTGNRYEASVKSFLTGGSSASWPSWHVTIANNSNTTELKVKTDDEISDLNGRHFNGAVVAPEDDMPAEPLRWQQPRFAIGWCPWGIGLDYPTLAGANFTIALQGGDAAQCKKHGLGCIAPALPTAAGTDDHDVIWGYNVIDEPGLAQFPMVAEDFKTIRRLRPGSMGFANLLQVRISNCAQSNLHTNLKSGPAPAGALPVGLLGAEPSGATERHGQQLDPVLRLP